MVLASDRVSRGKRVQEIQRACGYGEGKKADNAGFTERLNSAARELGMDANWTKERLSKVRSGTQDLSIEDVTVIASLDKERRGEAWVAHGIAVAPGDDPFAVLARAAKKRKTG